MSSSAPINDDYKKVIAARDATHDKLAQNENFGLDKTTGITIRKS